MKKTLLFTLLALLLTNVPAAVAQFSTDTCCRPAQVRTSVLPAFRGHWQLGFNLGVANQYQRTAFRNKLFGDVGPWLSFSADYFVKRQFGLGIQAGYFGFSLQRQHELYIRDVLALMPQFSGQTGLLQSANLHSFQLLIGPTFRRSLGRRLSGSANVRAGLFFNDAPITGAYDAANEKLLFRFSPAADRFRPGLTASLALEHTLNQSVRLGLRGGGFLSELTYNVDGPEGTFSTFSRALVGYSVQVSAALTLQTRRSGAVPVMLPTCYPPALPDPAITYDLAQQPQPVFVWHSGAPVYATGETFTLRLYALPGNQLLDERTTDARMMPWLPTLKIPDSTAQFYYTIQSSRQDQAGQSCVSRAVTGSVRFYKREAVRVDVARETAPLTVDIFEVRLKPASVITAASAGSGKRKPAPVRGQRGFSAKKQTITRPASVTAAPVPPTIDVLIFREITRRNEVIWPTGIPYPEQPTLYRYVLRTEAGVIQNQYTLLVTPGLPGTVRVLTNTERDQWLRGRVKPG